MTGLVAPSVVNTMPEATLNAVAGHGQIPGDGIRRSYDQSQAVLDELAALGIDCNDVVQVLEDQGVAAFDASWDHLGQRLASALTSGAPDVTATRAWVGGPGPWHLQPAAVPAREASAAISAATAAGWGALRLLAALPWR